MNRVLKALILTCLVFVFFQCQKREDKTIQKNLLTFLISCNGGSLQACQAQCAAAYPVVTGDNFPAVSACQTNCSTNCNLSTVYLLISSK